MNEQIGELNHNLLLLLAKGAVWLTICAMARWLVPNLGITWRSGLAGLVLLTAFSLFPAGWTWTSPPSAGAEMTPGIRQGIPDGPSADSTSFSADSTLRQFTASRPGDPVNFPWRSGLAILWSGGFAGLFCWLLSGFCTARRWVRRAVPPADRNWQTLLGEECQRQSLPRIPRLLISPDAPGPCVAGCFRPVVLLPSCCQEWDSGTRILVIRHEIAHLRHRDAPHAWIRAFALAIHWMNPLVWLAVSRSRYDEELAADDAVLSSGVRADLYAATLLQVARSCRFCSRTPLVTAMAHSSNLESRVRLLLGKNSAAQSPVRFATAGICLTFITAGFFGCSTVQPEFRNPDGINLPGAPTPNISHDIAELKKLFAADRTKAKQFTVKCRVIDLKGTSAIVPFYPYNAEGAPLTFSHSISLRLGQNGNMECIREFPYPTRFNLPDLAAFAPPRAAGGGSFPVTPATPQEYKFKNIGWEASQVTVRQDGAWLMVSGTFRETTFDGFIQNAGEAFSPIIAKGRNALGMAEEVVLTDNKVLSPAFTQRETPFTVAALPGKTYRVRLNLKQADAFLEVTCTPEKE